MSQTLTTYIRAVWSPCLIISETKMQQALSKGIEPLFATVSARILHSSWYEGMQPSVTAIKRVSS